MVWWVDLKLEALVGRVFFQRSYIQPESTWWFLLVNQSSCWLHALYYYSLCKVRSGLNFCNKAKFLCSPTWFFSLYFQYIYPLTLQSSFFLCRIDVCRESLISETTALLLCLSPNSPRFISFLLFVFNIWCLYFGIFLSQMLKWKS